MRDSSWQIIWEPTGASPRVLLDFGDLMDEEIAPSNESLEHILRHDFARSGRPVQRRNLKRRLTFGRRIEHDSAAASWERCSEELAALPWKIRGVISIRVEGGLPRFFRAAIADSSHEPDRGFKAPESVHEYSLRIAPLSAMILPNGLIVTGGYYVPGGGGYYVPPLPPEVELPPGGKVILTGSPGVTPGNYVLPDGGPPGGGGGVVPLDPEEETPLQPSVISPPVISGDPTAGGALGAVSGAYANATAVIRQWLFNNSPTGAGGMAYVIPADAEAGDRVQLQEIAFNGALSVIATSNIVTVIDVPPEFLTAPVIAGDTEAGSLLTVTPGTWNNAVSITHEWRINGVPFGGNVLAVHIPIDAEDGDDIYCRETASNGVGPAFADSNIITVAERPKNLTPPVISGEAEAGAVLTATPGTWEGATGVTGRWYLNSAATSDTDLNYTIPIGAEDGETIFYRETATNEVGPKDQDSNTIIVGGEFDDAPIVLAAADLWVSFFSDRWRGMRNYTLALEYFGLPAGTTIQIGSDTPFPADTSGTLMLDCAFSFQVQAFPMATNPGDNYDAFTPVLDGQDYEASEQTTHAEIEIGGATYIFFRGSPGSIQITVRNAEDEVLGVYNVIPNVTTTCRMREGASTNVSQATGRSMRLVPGGTTGVELLTPNGFLVY